MTVGELLDRVSSSELVQWQALFRREDAALAEQKAELERKQRGR